MGDGVLKELKRVIEDSQITKEDDNRCVVYGVWLCIQGRNACCNRWPAPDRVGRQELEVVIGNEHISFVVGARV